MDPSHNVSEDCILFPSSLCGTQAKDEESRRKWFAIPKTKMNLKFIFQGSGSEMTCKVGSGFENHMGEVWFFPATIVLQMEG